MATTTRGRPRQAQPPREQRWDRSSALADLKRDVLTATRALLAAEPGIAAILLECSAFCPFTARIRAETALPAVDFLTLGNLPMASVRAL